MTNFQSSYKALIFEKSLPSEIFRPSEYYGRNKSIETKIF